jgi:V-type H+-transporting ATPase subunit A
MPGDAGYPAYLSTRLAFFYERAGRVTCLGNGKIGSVTIVGAVSPPGGDFADPVTTCTLAIVQVFWGLDKRLAQKKHFPSVNWDRSFTKYDRGLKQFYSTSNPEFMQNVAMFTSILGKESSLQEIVQLVGKDSLGEEQKLQLDIARIIREDYLMQNAFSKYDYTCPINKTAWMMKNICLFYTLSMNAVNKEVEPKITWDRIKKKLKSYIVALTEMKFKDPAMDPANVDASMLELYNSIKTAFKEL